MTSSAESLRKLERKHGERMAGVALDPAARNLLGALDRETAIKWEDLPDRAGGDWPDAARAAALLSGANLCEATSTRLGLSEYGDRVLAEEHAARGGG